MATKDLPFTSALERSAALRSKVASMERALAASRVAEARRVRQEIEGERTSLRDL